MLADDTIRRWADLLADYCLQVRPGETVVVAAETPALRLVDACARAVVDRGGHPLVRLELPGLAEYVAVRATDDQLAHLPAVPLYEAGSADARIRISAESDTRSMARVDPARLAAIDRARRPIRAASSRKRWVLTQFPTQTYADDAKMDLAAYEAYVCRSMFLDTPEPAESWRALGRRQAGLAEFMTGANRIRIEGPGTDMTLDVGGRTWINSDGRRNMPSGEIFTGPLESSANGRLRCGFPVCRGGREVVGIALEFVDGVVVSARADAGEDYLRSMLDLDPGARRLGELGIGLNAGIDRFTGSILYDEKIGGTVHLALGQSYPETGGTNESALHWDLIVDLRAEGRVWADGRLAMEAGRWLVGHE